MAWQEEIEAGQVSRADIARREGLTRARVTQVMSLLNLSSELKVKMQGGHADVARWSVRQAQRRSMIQAP